MIRAEFLIKLIERLGRSINEIIRELIEVKEDKTKKAINTFLGYKRYKE